MQYNLPLYFEKVNLLEQRIEAAKEESLNQLGHYCSHPSER